MEELGNRLKLIREILGLTQREISHSIGVGLRSWQDYESDSNKPGSLVLSGLCSLGINGHWLLTGKGLPLISDVNSDGGFKLELIKKGWKPNQIQDNSDTVSIPAWADVTNDCIVFRVGDDSMINAGIGTGCCVVVKPTDDVNSGAIALVDLWGALTVKHYYCSSKGEVLLKPANNSHVETRFNIEESVDIKPVGLVVAAYKLFTGEY